MADVTGLDPIGIPVWLAIRPNAPTLTIASGKGATADAARASAVMEAIEIWHAEIARPAQVTCPYVDLPSDARPALADLPLTREGLFHPDLLQPWAAGLNLLDDQPAYAPAVMVGFGRTYTSNVELFCFPIGSNGLASGNTWDEAVASALYEVIERDAVACVLAAAVAGVARPPRVTPAAFPDPVRELGARIARAGSALKVWDYTTDLSVPVFAAEVTDPTGRVPGRFAGWGAHLDPAVALTRAVTEAVQSRVVYVAGARDDLKRTRSRPEVDRPGLPESVEPECDRLPPSAAGESAGDDVRILLRRLAAAGFRHATAFDLSRPEWPVRVARVVVPGLEGYLYPNYRPGRRARAAAGGLR